MPTIVRLGNQAGLAMNRYIDAVYYPERSREAAATAVADREPLGQSSLPPKQATLPLSSFAVRARQQMEMLLQRQQIAP